MDDRKQAAKIVAEVKKAVVGKDDVVVKVLLAVLAGGHVLLEDIPGVGKTTLALAFSKTLGLRCNRVQFTPDVMPSDVTGFSMFNRETGKMEYQDGAVLCNLFLADELNRATSRAQSALLEAMEEGQVTVDGVSHRVPQPFIVMATQNPVGASGTQLLPDSQMDRFMICLTMGYPGPEEERMMVRRREGRDPLEEIGQVVDAKGLAEMKETVAGVYLADSMLDYIVRLMNATRKHPKILQGASPRATLALTAAVRAMAFLADRDYVVPQDVEYLFHDVIAHRLILAPKSEPGLRGEVLREAFKQVRAPRIR